MFKGGGCSESLHKIIKSQNLVNLKLTFAYFAFYCFPFQGLKMSLVKPKEYKLKRLLKPNTPKNITYNLKE